MDNPNARLVDGGTRLGPSRLDGIPRQPERDVPRGRSCSQTSRPSPRAALPAGTNDCAPMARHPPTVTLPRIETLPHGPLAKRTATKARGADVASDGAEHEPRTSAAPRANHRMTANGGACRFVEGACKTFRNWNERS